MKQKLLKLTLAFAVILVLFISSKTVNATSYKYKINNNATATITRCDTSATGSITIPSEIDGYPVTAIGENAFFGCSKLTTITIPDSVTSIGEDAFYGCTKLTGITIPDSVTTIGSDAFYGCSGLEKINWNAVCVSDITGSIDVFYNAGASGNGIEVVFGDSVQKIPSYLFYVGSSSYRPKITSVTIGNNVTTIGDYAFYYCSGFTSITIPDSVTSIGDYAFYNCSGLTSITIPDSVTSIGDYAFYDTSFYNNSSNWENGALYIGNHFIKAKSNISGEYNIKNGTITLAHSAFYDCSGLTSITIPDSVTTIGEDAFYNCSKLTGITIGNSVTTIGKNAFYNCTGLTSITIPNSVTSIGNYAFYNCTGLTSITIPDSVTNIGNYAFSVCSGLTTITIPDSVTSIGEGAFSFCFKLTGITIPDSVTTIGSSAFYSCSKLTTITIFDSVTSIGEGAFRYCYGLEKINWNAVYVSDFTSSSNVFYKAGAYRNGIEVVFGDSVQKIPAYLFYVNSSSYRPKITSVTIGNNVTDIGERAFYDCSGLTSITIPDSVTSIGSGAFNGCSGITEINIPSSIQSIGSNAFPSGLKKAYVDKDLEQLPKRTFVDYASLEVVVFYGKQTKISNEEFFGCNNVAISGYPGSYAETYADDNLFDFIPLEATETTVTATSYAGNDTIIIYANISEQVDDECLHIALYNSNNTLVDYIIIPPNKPFDSMNVAFKDDDNAAYAKVFLWKNMISAQPIADAVRVDIYR